MKVKVPKGQEFTAAVRIRELQLEQRKLAFEREDVKRTIAHDEALLAQASAELEVRRQELALARTVVGPPGAPGKDGERGIDGSVGPQGERGLPGMPGVDGQHGRDGKDGVQGPQGVPGADGKRGVQGARGEAGQRGADGKDGKSPQWRGEWQQGTTYKVGDLVSFEGSTWIAVVPGPLVRPGSDPGQWGVVALKGADGRGGRGPDLSNATPAALGVAAAGTSGLASRADHVHATPNLSAYLPLAGGTMTGDLDIGTPTQLGAAQIRIGAAAPYLLLESTGADAVGGLFFGTPSNAFTWVLAGAVAGNANDGQEFRLADGNTIHWSVRATGTSRHDARQYWGPNAVTATSDGHFTFKHVLTAGTGVGNNISTLVIKGADGTANNGGKPLDIQTAAGATVASVSLAGAAAFSSTVTGSNLSGTNTGDLTLASVGAVPAAAGASLSGQVLTLQPADATNPGVVGSGAQSFPSGLKTFTGAVTVGGILTMPALTSITFGAGGSNAGLQNGAGQYTGLCRAMNNGSSWPMPATIFHTATSASNGTTVETTLATHVANQFGNDLDLAARGFKIYAFGTFASNANTKTIKLKADTTDLTGGLFTGAFNGGGWYVESVFLRSSGTSAQVVCSSWWTSSATPVRGGNVTTSAVATASSYNNIVTGQSGTASGDITLLAMRVEFLP